MLTIFLVLVRVVTIEAASPVPASITGLLDQSIVLSLWACLVLTVFSGVMFFWRHRRVLRDAVR
jgi:hypothetical protein